MQPRRPEGPLHEPPEEHLAKLPSVHYEPPAPHGCVPRSSSPPCAILHGQQIAHPHQGQPPVHHPRQHEALQYLDAPSQTPSVLVQMPCVHGHIRPLRPAPTLHWERLQGWLYRAPREGLPNLAVQKLVPIPAWLQTAPPHAATWPLHICTPLPCQIQRFVPHPRLPAGMKLACCLSPVLSTLGCRPAAPPLNVAACANELQQRPASVVQDTPHAPPRWQHSMPLLTCCALQLPDLTARKPSASQCK
mmetsp:Transcript_53942/g.107374  ORF Transcript_53942/g.107374 Transcript_53942/m.107374 type:complete len:247 (-) Transcript_53942:1248-1988(-)